MKIIAQGSYLLVNILLFVFLISACSTRVQEAPIEETSVKSLPVEAATEQPAPATARSLTTAVGSDASGQFFERLCAGESVTESDFVNSRLGTLCYVWYPGSTITPPPAENILEEACGTRDYGSGTEALFRDTLNNESLLCFYATLDQDNDGAPDFRVTADGSFLENDPDADNDGVHNVLDANPGDAAVGGTPLVCGEDNLPVWLNWSEKTLADGSAKSDNVKKCSGRDAEACRIQARLFNEFGIVTYERDAVFNLKTLYAVEDVITRVYASQFKTDGACRTMATLKVVNASKCAALPNPGEDKCTDDDTTLGEAQAHNASMTLFNYGMTQSSMDLLGLLVHELAHSVQFSMDAETPGAINSLLTDNFWDVPQYEQYLTSWGWELPKLTDRTIRKKRAAYDGVLFSADEIVAFKEKKYKFKGSTLKQLRKDIEAIGIKRDRENNSLSQRKYDATVARLNEASVVGAYSLTDPWEWHADTVTSYVYRMMENRLAALGDSEISTEVRDHFRSLQFVAWWDDFYYASITEEFVNAMHTEMGLSEEDATALMCRYFIHGDDYVFDPERSVLNSEDGQFEYPDGLTSNQIKDLSERAKAVYVQICTGVI